MSSITVARDELQRCCTIRCTACERVHEISMPYAVSKSRHQWLCPLDSQNL